jgi:hypothetical protein
VTPTQKQGAIGLVLLFGLAVGAHVALGGNSPSWVRRRGHRRRPNPWITLKRGFGRGRAVFISDEGRIEKGLPAEFEGVHVQDLTAFSRRLRELEKARKTAERDVTRGRGRGKFGKVEEAVKALLAANPHLAQFLEDECSKDCVEFDLWRRRGRRGPKPRWQPGDGRFDAINERFERRSRGRKVASWLEATYVTVPSSRRWDDFAARLPVLEEATGLRLNLPAPAERRAHASTDVAEVHSRADARIADLLALARSARLTSGPADEDAPF